MSGADRPERKALETFHARAAADVRHASPEREWDTVAVSRFRVGKREFALPPLLVPVIGINYGAQFRLECTLHGKTHAARVVPGHVAIAPPDFATRWTCEQAGDVVVVYLSRDVLVRAIEEGTSQDPRSVEIIPRFVIRDLTLERIAHQLLQEIIRRQGGTRVRVDTLAQELAVRLIGSHSNLNRPLNRRVRGIAPARLRRAKEFIHANLGQDPSLAQVAAAAEMTLFHFAKAFKETTGLPPHQYITEQRVLAARTLLHDPLLTIGSVASAVGFGQSHFTSVFKRHMGMTPGTFRDVLRS